MPTRPPPRRLSPAAGSSVGRVVDVEVVVVRDRDVEVRLADGRTGVIDRREFDTAPAVGSAVPAALLARDDPQHRVVMSHRWARQQRAWERVASAKQNATALTGPVVKVVAGGLVVDLGVRAFLPASMVDEHPVGDLAAMVGGEVTVVVTEVDMERERVVVSRRDHLRRARREVEKQAFGSLRVGQTITGTVVAVQDYGLHIEIMGVRGLLHRSELSWTRPPRPSEVAAIGDDIEVVIVELNRTRRRLGLSLRRRSPDPLAAVVAGGLHPATVTTVLDYGVFARLDDVGVEGLVHLTEMSELPGARPDQLVTPGESVTVKVLSVDPERRRIKLSMRQAVAG